jgi:CRISPR/Cas system-associated exonuclease Cas4 (RecB family)
LNKFGYFPETQKLQSLPWNRFLQRSSGASSLAEYWYCPAKIINSVSLGAIETEEKTTGTEFHETETTRIIKSLGPLRKVKVKTLYDVMRLSYENLVGALRRREVIANSENQVLFWSIVPDLGIVGVPDKADCQEGGEPVLIDFKTTARLPGEPWVDNRIQLGAYMIGLERLGFRQTYGLLKYVLRDEPSSSVVFKLYLDDYLRNQVARTSQEVARILDGTTPTPTKNPKKCRACEYHYLCKWSQAKDVALSKVA